MYAIALAILMLCANSAFAAEAYRWVDKNGGIHYGDRPAQGAQMIDVQPASGNGPSPEMRAHDAECERQKAQLETYRNASRFTEENAQGQRRDLSADEARQFMANAETKANEACAPLVPPR